MDFSEEGKIMKYLGNIFSLACGVCILEEKKRCVLQINFSEKLEFFVVKYLYLWCICFSWLLKIHCMEVLCFWKGLMVAAVSDYDFVLCGAILEDKIL